MELWVEGRVGRAHHAFLSLSRELLSVLPFRYLSFPPGIFPSLPVSVLTFRYLPPTDGAMAA